MKRSTVIGPVAGHMRHLVHFTYEACTLCCVAPRRFMTLSLALVDVANDKMHEFMCKYGKYFNICRLVFHDMNAFIPGIGRTTPPYPS